MLGSLRLSMNWLHTWFGVALGAVLMVAFFFGSLSVFDREIDRWAIPETRFPPQPMPSFDTMLVPIFRTIVPDEQPGGRPSPTPRPTSWSVYATHRDPALTLYAGFNVSTPRGPEVVYPHVMVDPRSGAVLPHGRLKIGSEFFYPLHFDLTLRWKNLGRWVVALAALAMLATLVSGIVVHRRILREFFTLRPERSPRRTALDLHNLTGVVALPFHFFFALSGLIIFAATYFPVSGAMFGQHAQAYAHAEAEAKGLPAGPAGIPRTLASVDAMVAEAKRRWAARGIPGEVGFLEVQHVGDINSTVSIHRAGTDRIALVGEAVHFQGTTGRVLYEEPPRSALAEINEFVAGLHMQHFRHWLLRWLWVLGGLAGCVCIATGFIFFVEKRKRRHAEKGVGGARWVDALAVTAITGMVVATLSMLAANRLLPAELADRGGWEKAAFWGAWLLAFAHAAWRTAPVRKARLVPAWREQCWAIAVLAASAALLNWMTTGDHLFRTVSAGSWPVAGFDLALLTTAAVGAAAALRLRPAVQERREPDAAPERGPARA